MVTGTEATYSGMIGWLVWFSSALNANAADLAHLEEARLHPARIVADVAGMARKQAAFTASEQESSGQLQKHHGPRSEAPAPIPATTTAHPAADTNSTQ